MQATVNSIGELIQSNIRYRIPIFQRRYVWEKSNGKDLSKIWILSLAMQKVNPSDNQVVMELWVK